MNVNEMTTQEKTIKLATLCQWEISEVDEQWRVWVKAPDCKHSTTDLYQEWAMFLAWRVLNWGAAQDKIGFVRIGAGFKHVSMNRAAWLFCELVDQVIEIELTPEEAQAEWLDKILELAIEAGMIE